MRLSREEQAMLEGASGRARRWAMAHMLRVGRFFDAEDFVEVSQAHLMADTESLGEAGVALIEDLAALPVEERRVRVPTTSDPRGTDLAHYRTLKQSDAMVAIERRAIAAFRALGILMADTCIPYQTVMPPFRGEHLACGDTGVAIYANSVCGAYSNFEGGPSALAAALAGRTPRYGLHLDANRKATCRFRVTSQPQGVSDWGALGGIIGRLAGSYWQVPAIEGIAAAPDSDALKHLGAAMASFGSVPMYHLVGHTPEAPTIEAVCAPETLPCRELGRPELDAFYAGYGAKGDKVDVVVFSAPQLSLIEMRRIAELLEGKQVHPKTALLVITSPAVAADAKRLGIVEPIEAAGGLVLQGMCFYQSYAREIGLANGWTRLLTNSAKLVNIIGGYGYRPSLASMADCIASAVAGEIVR